MELDIFVKMSRWVINKMPGIVCIRLPAMIGYDCNALPIMPGLSGIGGVARPGIVHRLDKDTSGAFSLRQERLHSPESGPTIQGAYDG